MTYLKDSCALLGLMIVVFGFVEFVLAPPWGG